MILLTIRSLTYSQNKLFFAIQLSVCTLFTLLSDCTVAYLIFYECRIKKSVQVILPPVVYFISHIIWQKQATPDLLFHTLLLAAISAGISLAEKWITAYFSIKNQNLQAVSITALSEMYEKKLNKELMIKNYLADKNARLEERETISRNIHNSVGHSITAAIMALDAADMLFDTSPEKAREKMNTAKERIRAGLNSIRHAVRVLDQENTFISLSDFISGLISVTDNFIMDTCIQIHTNFPDPDLELYIPHEHTEFLTGAMQELLTNGVRHGNADLFIVYLTADSRHIKLSVLDNGTSNFCPENAQEKIRDGFGLKKLISYATRCGGSAIFENHHGFQSIITLPIKENE